MYFRCTKYYMKTESRYGRMDNRNRGSYSVGLCISLNFQSLILLLLPLLFEKNSGIIKSGGVFFIGTFILVIYYSKYFFGKRPIFFNF